MLWAVCSALRVVGCARPVRLFACTAKPADIAVHVIFVILQAQQLQQLQQHQATQAASQAARAQQAQQQQVSDDPASEGTAGTQQQQASDQAVPEAAGQLQQQQVSDQAATQANTQQQLYKQQQLISDQAAPEAGSQQQQHQISDPATPGAVAQQQQGGGIGVRVSLDPPQSPRLTVPSQGGTSLSKPLQQQPGPVMPAGAQVRARSNMKHVDLTGTIHQHAAEERGLGNEFENPTRLGDLVANSDPAVHATPSKVCLLTTHLCLVG